MTATPEATERKLRKSWALARIAELVNEGRERGWLDGHVVDSDSSQRLLEKIATRVETETPMRALQQAFALGDIEMNVLWLLALLELDPQLATASQVLHAAGQHQLSAMIVEQLADCDGETLEHLMQLGLVEGDASPSVPLYRRVLRAHDRVIDLVRGKRGLDRELGKVAELVAPTAADIAVPPGVTHALTSGAADAFIVATGVAGSGRKTLLRAAAARAGRSILEVRASAIASDAATASRQLRAIARECQIHGALPLLLDIDALADRAELVERELFARLDRPVLATAREAITWSRGRAMQTVPVALPDEPTRAALWQQAMPAASAELVTECARRYTISAGMIARAASAAVAMAGDDELELGHVHLALRAQLETKLLGLATRIETTQRWADLVMPQDQLELLGELVSRVEHRRRVLDTWGFANKVGRGVGLSVLLSGPPGTGKTMVAGLVARELGLDLYQVDLSKIVSKYIGETEKQLAQLFEAAESGHCILLFDEADSMFGKRTEVKSSNDRYANLEVNYLLQRMEAFSGITILTTNHETAIDPAFQRRLAMHVRVPMPDEQHRAQLWQSMLPEAAPLQGSADFERLANDFVMSGGYIKNAVLRAAYLAAGDDSAITPAHLWRAAHAEYEGMGKVTKRAM